MTPPDPASSEQKFLFSPDARFMVRTDQYVIYELDPTNGEYRLLTVTEHAGVATMYLTSGTPTSEREINIST